MEKCPKDIMDFHMPRRDNENRRKGSLIIELEFEKVTLDPYIIIVGEKIQLRMKETNSM